MTQRKEDQERGDKGCPRCHDRAGHSMIEDAACAYRVATTAAIGVLAHGLGVDGRAAADLLAHLRSVFPDAQAYAAARYILELGWRPVVGGVS